MDIIFSGIFDNNAGLLTLPTFIYAMSVSLILGILVTLVYEYKATYSKTFLRSVAIIPAIICAVIMMVRGSLGAGIVIAGVFSLFRFRSNAGSAKEITSIFFSSAIGIACGMGYPLFAILFTLIIALAYFILEKIEFGTTKNLSLKKTLRITVPEDLEYANMFDEIFKHYTNEYELIAVKTTNLGSLNRLSYNITLKELAFIKPMIDDLRVLNGNLEISLTLQATSSDSL